MAKEKKDERDERIVAVRKLVDKANQNADGKQALLYGLEELGGEDVGFDASLLQDTADPEKSYRLYYAIQRMLKDNLPFGKQNKRLRQYVYDEKNVFLNQGKAPNNRGVRGSDGRMTYISTFLEPTFNAVADWVKSGGSSFEIFMTFYNLNEAHGFHKKDDDTPEATFDQN